MALSTIEDQIRYRSRSFAAFTTAWPTSVLLLDRLAAPLCARHALIYHPHRCALLVPVVAGERDMPAVPFAAADGPVAPVVATGPLLAGGADADARHQDTSISPGHRSSECGRRCWQYVSGKRSN